VASNKQKINWEDVKKSSRKLEISNSSASEESSKHLRFLVIGGCKTKDGKHKQTEAFPNCFGIEFESI